MIGAGLRVRAGMLLLALCSVTRPAFSHGGEDHAAPAAARAAVIGTEHIASGETATFSAVVKYPAKRGEGPLLMRVYVADTESSAPVVDATVRLELKGAATLDQEIKKTEAPGVYEASIPAPPDGTHVDGIVSVQTKSAFDLVVLGKLSFGPMDPPPAVTAAAPKGVPIWQAAVGAATVAALGAAAGFAIGRRSRRKGRQEGAPPGEKPAPAGAIS